MAAKRHQERKDLVAQPDKAATVAAEKTKVKARREVVRGKAKEKTRPEWEEALAKAQAALKTARANLKRERQARAKAEQALAETQEALAAARLKAGQEHQAQIRRVSFVVRLMVDEHGQPRRTEVEEVESSRKQNFLGLDGERLVAFMKASFSDTIIPENPTYTAPPPEKPTTPVVGSLRPNSSLIVSDVQVFHSEDPDVSTLTLTPEQPFIIQARFILLGPEAQILTAQQSPFDIKVYANDITSGKSTLLTTYSAMLIQDVLRYTTPVEVQGLSHGLYRLFTLVILQRPIKLAGFYGKTIIQVT